MKDESIVSQGDCGDATPVAPLPCGFVCFLLVFLAYLGSAALSLSLSHPYGTWPVISLSAGVALAMFLVWGWKGLPGIGAGALAMAIWDLSGAGGESGGVATALIVLGTAASAIAGPAAGACLTRFFGGSLGSRSLRSGGIRLFGLGAVGGGLVGASLATVIARTSGAISPEITGAFWLSQVMALSLGMVTMTPILLASVLERRPGRSRISHRLILPHTVALISTLAILTYVAEVGIRQSRMDVEKEVEERFMVLEREATAHLESLMSIGNLWESSRVMDAEKFQTISERPLLKNQALDLLLWAPQISAEEWPTFRTKRENLPASGEELTPRTAPHFPAIYAEPKETGEAVLGTDLTTISEISEMLATEMSESPTPLSTRSFAWQGENRLAILLWVDPPQRDEPNQQGTHPRPGYVIAFLDPEALLKAAGRGMPERPWEYFLTENKDGSELPDSPENRSPDFAPSDSMTSSGGGVRATVRQFPFPLADRVWYFTITKVGTGHAIMPSRSVYGVQAAFLLLIILLGILLLSDIGRNHQIEKAVTRRTAELAEAESRFRQLAENINEGFWIVNADGRTIDYLSVGFEKIWQCRADAMLAEPENWDKSVVPDDQTAFRSRFGGDGNPAAFDLEYRIRRPDGEIRWIRDRGFPLFDDAGKLLKWTGVADDTTIHKGVEQNLLKAQHEAVEANELLEKFFSLSPDLWCVAGLDGYFRKINPAFTQNLGYSVEVLSGHPFLDFVHPEDKEKTIEAVSDLARGCILAQFQNRYQHRDGHYVWLEWSSVPDIRGERIYAVARNVTERRQMEDELRRSNEELEQFAYVASHDMQEPLRMVTSFVQLLQRRYGEKLDETANEYIRYAVEGSERMRRLILGLLELSRVERNKKPLLETAADDSLDAAIGNLGSRIAESGTRLHREPLPRLRVDPDQLTRMFQNLIANSINYCDTTPEIYITAAREGDEWIFTVEDNGPGIAPEHQERIFQVFHRLQLDPTVSGTGIGLAICRRIATRHGGRIWVEKGQQGGAAFRFSFPANDSNAIDLSTPEKDTEIR